VTKSKGRVFFTEGQATGEKGKFFSTAVGKYIEADDDLKAALMNSLDELCRITLYRPFQLF